MSTSMSARALGETASRDAQKAQFRWLAASTALAMLAVIAWGAYVRISGSGAGCGSHWPTCNGEIIPHPKSIKTIIELTHRLTTGALVILVIAQTVAAFRWFPIGSRVRLAAGFCAGFLVSESLLGAGLVLFEKVAGDKSASRALWSAAHLTNTFLLIGSMSLVLWWSLERPAAALDRTLRLTFALAMGGLLLVGMAGAIAALGDTLFPVQSLREGMAQDIQRSSHFLVRLRVIHPLLAVVVALALGRALPGIVRARHDRARATLGWTLLSLLVAQVVVGVANWLLLAPTALQLLHLALADLVWMSLVALTAASAEAPAIAAESS